MDTVTKATSEGIDDELRIHLAEMKARPTVEDTIPIPLNDAELARRNRLTSLRGRDRGAELAR